MATVDVIHLHNTKPASLPNVGVKHDFVACAPANAKMLGSLTEQCATKMLRSMTKM